MLGSKLSYVVAPLSAETRISWLTVGVLTSSVFVTNKADNKMNSQLVKNTEYHCYIMHKLTETRLSLKSCDSLCC